MADLPPLEPEQIAAIGAIAARLDARLAGADQERAGYAGSSSISAMRIARRTA